MAKTTVAGTDPLSVIVLPRQQPTQRIRDRAYEFASADEADRVCHWLFRAGIAADRITPNGFWLMEMRGE